jgi:hypothetical protein
MEAIQAAVRALVAVLPVREPRKLYDFESEGASDGE